MIFNEEYSQALKEIESLQARVEELEAALRIVPGFVTNRARAEFVRDKLAATEQEDSRPALKRSIKHTEDQLSGLSEAIAAIEKEKSE